MDEKKEARKEETDKAQPKTGPPQPKKMPSPYPDTEQRTGPARTADTDPEQAEPEPTTVTIPAGGKFILLFEAPGQALALQTGGFVNLDEMLGFNRRACNPNLVEQMIIAGLPSSKSSM